MTPTQIRVCSLEQGSCGCWVLVGGDASLSEGVVNYLGVGRGRSLLPTIDRVYVEKDWLSFLVLASLEVHG